MAEVKRYKMERASGCKECGLIESERGMYMFHCDHTAIVAALERRLRVMQRAFDNTNRHLLYPEAAIEQAEREIDSEQKEQEG